MSGFGSASGRGEHPAGSLGAFRVASPPVSTLPSDQPPAPALKQPFTFWQWNQPHDPWVRNWLVANKKLLFALCIALFVISFNGRWRIGLDSSIYRGLAANLAAGKGYVFGEFGTHQVYPGLPILLAAVQKLTGESVFRPVFSLLVIWTMGLATLLVTYKLIRLHYAEWMAIAVTALLATNERFLQHSNELLTDVPFLLGLVSAMYGWDRLRLTERWDRQRFKAIAILTCGLVLAATMRPTFWILGLAWLGVCLAGLIRGRRRAFYATCVLALLLVWAIVTAVDPRTRGFHPLSGGYESEALDVVRAVDDQGRTEPLVKRIATETPRLLEEHLPDCLFGVAWPWHTGIAVSVILLGATAVLLLPRQPVWALLILLTVAVTATLSTAPRYYIMILPFLILVALLLTDRLAQRLPGGYRDLAVGLAIGTIFGMNLAKVIPFVREQHRVGLANNSLRYYDKYRGGDFSPVLKLCDLIEQHTPPDAKIIAPSASIVQYLTGRRVYMERELLPPKLNQLQYPEHLRSLPLDYLVFPGREYRDKEPQIARLIYRGILAPGKRIAYGGGYILTGAAVNVPPPGVDWRKGPIPDYPIPSAAMAATRANSAATRAAATRATATRATTRPAPHVNRRSAATAPTTKSAEELARDERRRKKRAAQAATAQTPPPATAQTPPARQ
jgi:hypothetical protein